MPIYEYRCENGHTFEVMQRMTDDSISECSTCGAPVQRVFHPVAVHFKGSGFYTTDYGKKTGKGSKDGGAPESKSSETSDSTKKKDSTEKKAPAKSSD
jgi:putative FmdB family regulatory protein